MNVEPPLLSGEVLEEEVVLTFAELSHTARLPAEELLVLIDEGIIEPQNDPAGGWRFHGVSVRRVQCAVKLHRDLGINWAGAALALDLLEEVRELRSRLKAFDPPA